MLIVPGANNSEDNNQHNNVRGIYKTNPVRPTMEEIDSSLAENLIF